MKLKLWIVLLLIFGAMTANLAYAGLLGDDPDTRDILEEVTATKLTASDKEAIVAGFSP